jgi:hypothetical protein
VPCPVPFNLTEWSYEAVNVTLLITGSQPSQNGGFPVVESDLTYQFGLLGPDGSFFTPKGMYRYVEQMMNVKAAFPGYTSVDDNGMPITNTTKTCGAWGDVYTIGGTTYRRNVTWTTVNSKSIYVDVNSITFGLYPVAYPDYTSWQNNYEKQGGMDLAAFRGAQNRCAVCRRVAVCVCVRCMHASLRGAVPAR